MKTGDRRWEMGDGRGCSPEPSSVRSGRFIGSAPKHSQAPSGAACLVRDWRRIVMPLLTELKKSVRGPGYYKHDAPNGAVAVTSGWPEASDLGGGGKALKAAQALELAGWEACRPLFAELWCGHGRQRCRPNP